MATRLNLCQPRLESSAGPAATQRFPPAYPAAKLGAVLYDAYDFLEMPVAVVRAGAISYANTALAHLLGVTRAELVGRPIQELVRRFVVAGGVDNALQGYQRLDAASFNPHEFWIELQTPRGPSQACVRSHPGREPAEWLAVVAELPGVSEAQRFTRVLAQGAGIMLRAQDEQEILKIAADVLFAQGFFCSTFLFDGDFFKYGPKRLPAGIEERTAAAFGKPVPEIRIPLQSLPDLERKLKARSGTFHASALDVIRAVHQPRPDVAAIPVKTLDVPSIDVPLYVEGKPYGLFNVIGAAVTPALTASVELFAALVGSAIDVGRNAKRAADRLEEVRRLEREKLQRERLAVLGEAAAVVAHEVRNPLGAIINSVAVLRHERRLSPDGARVIDMIEEEAQRLDRLVGELLDFVRPLELKLRPVDLRAVARRAIDAWVSSSAEPRIEVELLPGADVPRVQGDEDTLRLALTNLVRNAVQASPRGGRVTVSIEHEGDLVALSVGDEGHGVPEADLAKIFTPFFTTRATGTGLGLAVVDRVAKLNGAQVDVARSSRGGARFSLRFPVPAKA